MRCGARESGSTCPVHRRPVSESRPGAPSLGEHRSSPPVWCSIEQLVKTRNPSHPASRPRPAPVSLSSRRSLPVEREIFIAKQHCEQPRNAVVVVAKSILDTCAHQTLSDLQPYTPGFKPCCCWMHGAEQQTTAMPITHHRTTTQQIALLRSIRATRMC